MSTVRAALSLGLLAWASPAFGHSDSSESFEQAIREAYLDIVQTGQPRRHRAPEKAVPRKKDILKTSERVFSASPDAAKELGHLRAFVVSQAAAEASEPEQAAAARDLLSSDDPGLAALVGISVFWHEAQHHYDRASDYRGGISHIGMELPMPIEMEKRGWEAGCRFWKAGIGLLVKPSDGDWPQSYYCENKFPPVYYCRLYFAVEIVALTAVQLKNLGRSRGQVIEDLSAQARVPGNVPASPTSPFERVFSAYCGEYERSERGNPLDLTGFDFRWGPDECLERAMKAILAPAWKGSSELCTTEQPRGADIRAAAKELQDWK